MARRAALVLNAGALEQLQSGDVATFGYPVQSKNKVINGNFAWWQRDSSFSVNNTYTADRWGHTWDGSGGTQTTERQAHTFGASLGAAGPRDDKSAKFYIRHSRSVVPTGQTFAYLLTKLEGLRNFEGDWTLSFYARVASTGGGSFSVLMQQNYGTGGSPSANVNQTQGFTLTSSWTHYKHTFNFSNSGKILGADGNDFLSINFAMFPGFTVSNLDIAYVQLEEGKEATEFDLRTPEAELLLCKRYYQRSYADNVANGATSIGRYVAYTMPKTIAASAAGSIYDGVIFPVPMRATPTVTIYNQNTGVTGSIYNFSTSLSRSGVTAVELSKEGITRLSVDNTSANALNDGNDIGWHWVASAEL